MRNLALCLFLLVAAAPAFAQAPLSPEPASFSDPALELRARNLQRQLRCLVCQGESVDESGSPFAADVRALVRRPGNATSWNGPYLKGGVVPTDPWKHDYVYRSPAEGAPFEIMSLGSDGREGGTGSAADLKSAAH